MIAVALILASLIALASPGCHPTVDVEKLEISGAGISCKF